ncbi:MAG TPA: ATP-binding protein [Xanthobacteraceae bacterium]
MARGEAASASARPDSIKGLAQSVAKPAYRRLLTAEPALRRAVPALIVAFLMTVGIGAIVQVSEHRRQALSEARMEINALADITAERLVRDPFAVSEPQIAQNALERAMPYAIPVTRHVLLTNASGVVIAAWPPEQVSVGRKLLDLVGQGQRLSMVDDKPGAVELMLPDDTAAFAAIRNLSRPLGQLAIVQTRSAVLAAWRSDAALTVTLFTTTGFVLLILGFAFHWQATRASAADEIYDTVRSRVDTALNSGRCGLWDWDLARGRIFWSHSMFEMLGLEPRNELLTFADVNALVHPDDTSLYRLTDTRSRMIDHAFRMRHAKGRWVWMRARCELVQQPGESGGHIVGIVVDITEQKDLAERTAAADVRLREAIDAISEAFVIWDADSRLVLCNSKFQSLHSLPDQAVSPGAPHWAVTAAGAQSVAYPPPPGRNTDTREGRTFEAQLDDGRWLQVSERRTIDGGFVSVGTDITLLKETQQALERQAEELVLLAEKYSEEKTRAEEANHAKSEFLANMSHELRTPLNAIIGFSEMMEAGVFGPLGAKYHEYCRDIRESGRYLLDVINDILDMSKIEAGKFDLGFEQFELGCVLGEALRISSPRAQGKQLALVVDIAPGLAVRADRRGVKQIVLNLLSNAIKFTPEGGSISVRAERIADMISIAVEDTGIGIPASAMPKLGKPFEQVQSPLTKSYQGSGLGLAIAKSLTEMHGGRMCIRSSQGVGTEVMVQLPGDALALQAECAVPNEAEC